MTESGIIEVSEQLGLLDEDTPENSYHGENSPEIFKGYIDCYLGPEKKWSNHWEDQTTAKGKFAYRKQFIKANRHLNQLPRVFTWLNADPDRNLIYGAVLFKLHLGIANGNYIAALKHYNVGSVGAYIRGVEKYYRTLSESEPVFGNVANNVYSFTSGNWACNVPEQEFAEVATFVEVTLDIMGEEETAHALAEKFNEQGFCRAVTQSI